MARTYDGSARTEAARATRRRILRAARALIEAEGYAAFSIAELARVAEVSPQTIYNAVGSKAEVLKATYDVTLAGDDEPVPMSERPAFVALGEARTLADWTAAYAHWNRVIHDHVGDLVGAVLRPGEALDGGAGAFAATIDAERRTGTGHAVSACVARFGVPRGLTEHELVDAAWTLNAPEVYDRLVRRSGWTPERYEEWLAGQLAAAFASR